MRQLIIALLAAWTLCASAQTTPPHSRSADLQDFTGQYVLQDGRVLTVVQRQRGLASQLDGGALLLLKPSGRATFATAKGELVLRFDQRQNGNVAGVTVSETAPSSSASVREH